MRLPVRASVPVQMLRTTTLSASASEPTTSLLSIEGLDSIRTPALTLAFTNERCGLNRCAMTVSAAGRVDLLGNPCAFALAADHGGTGVGRPLGPGVRG